MGFRDIRLPLYTITHREAVEDGGSVVLGFDFVVTGQVADETGALTEHFGLLLFSSASKAEACLARINVPGGIVATFRDKDHLRDCIRHFKNQGYLVVLFDRYSDGQAIEINLFLSIVEGQF